MTAPVVLVVEDDASIREVVAEVLSDEGYSVHTAQDGREALRELEAGLEPRLVLLDLMMPVMDGWSFLAEIERRGMRRPPTAIVSASSSRRRDPALKDVVAWLQKPVTIHELLGLVHRYCRDGAA
jgi:CheY-like chemotaxis protein